MIKVVGAGNDECGGAVERRVDGAVKPRRIPTRERKAGFKTKPREIGLFFFHYAPVAIGVSAKPPHSAQAPS